MIDRRSLIGFAVTSIVTARAQSTPPAVTPDRVRALLASEKINERAWGAYYAGAMGLTTEGPLIARLLHESLEARRQHSVQRDLSHFIEILADAAIRLRCPVPAKPLAALADYWRNHLTLILVQFMPSAPDKEALLLALLDRRPKGREGDTLAWTAIGNYLLALRSSPWVVRLMKEVDIAHRFIVVDPGSWGESGGVGGLAWGSGGWGVWPKDFPPRVVYYLTFDPAAGGALIAPGPRNVYAMRQEFPLDQPLSSSPANSAIFGVGKKHRLEYLAALASSGVSELEPLFQSKTRVEWDGDTALQKRIARETARQIKAIREFARRLARSGITGLDGLQLQILIEIEDSRQSKEVPLPAVPPPQEFTLAPSSPAPTATGSKPINPPGEPR
ncbi:MAG TPA: hypothetical protein PLF84_23945 [Bryobacteraceae bacterium]|nr:hypothetical protein [Bryobacterales bacterium]HRJ22118.1 hypothetical protein [Bryobacteraceae bacterium]